MKNLYNKIIHNLIFWAIKKVDAITIDPREEREGTIIHLHLFTGKMYKQIQFKANFVDEEKAKAHKQYTYLKKLNNKKRGCTCDRCKSYNKNVLKK